MSTPRRIHRGSTLVLSSLMTLIGAVLVVATLVRGGGPLSARLIIGILLCVAGALRLYAEWWREGRR